MSQEIRRIAQLLSGLSSNILSTANGSIRHSADEIPVNFKGEAAHELNVSINGMLNDIHASAGMLEKLAATLRTYAEMLDRADATANELIRSR